MNIEESQRQFMDSVERETLTIGDYAIIAFILLVIVSFIFSPVIAELLFRLTK
jgi:hypothetical protein